MASASIRMVDLLRETGAAVRGLALPAFMDNALQQVTTIRDGLDVGRDRRGRQAAAHGRRATRARRRLRLLRDASWDGAGGRAGARARRAVVSLTSRPSFRTLIGREVRYRRVSFD